MYKEYFNSFEAKIIKGIILVLFFVLSIILINISNKDETKIMYSFIGKDYQEIKYGGILDYTATIKKNGLENNCIKENFIEETMEEKTLEYRKMLCLTDKSIIEKQIDINPNYSILNTNVVLKLPLKKGNKWTTDIEYKGKKYTAETKIINKNDKMIQTETVIKNIENFPNNTYIENRTYELNKGLVNFKKTIEKINNEDVGFNFQMWEEK